MRMKLDCVFCSDSGVYIGEVQTRACTCWRGIEMEEFLDAF